MHRRRNGSLGLASATSMESGSQMRWRRTIFEEMEKPATNWTMTVLYLVPIVGLPILAAVGAFLLLTSTRPDDVPVRSADPAYTRTK
jgi:hypothetical protein